MAEDGRQDPQPQQAEEKIVRRPVPNRVKRRYLDLIEDNGGITAYRAWKKLKRDHLNVAEPQIRQWVKKSNEIRSRPNGSRSKGGGRKPLSTELEELLFEYIFQRRMAKERVTKKSIKNKALELARDLNITNFIASSGWMTRFFSRYELTLRQSTNLTKLTDLEVITRAADYFAFLRPLLYKYYPSHTVLMDETDVYYETTATSTVDVVGAKHVVMKTTGLSSMRIMAVLAVRASRVRVMPATIFKGKIEAPKMLNGFYTFSQPKGWVDADLLCQWIGLTLPKVARGRNRGLLIWDACRAHVSAKVKAYCASINIDMAVIPGGMTAYLQAGDISYYKSFKDILNAHIDEWKGGDPVEYTQRGHPRPPKKEVVNQWVRDSWKGVDEHLIDKGLRLAGVHGELTETFIAKHDVYGENFVDALKEREALQNDLCPQLVERDIDDELIIEGDDT